MPFYYIAILALVQGISEFLPISSSGHLVVTHYFLGDGETNLCWEKNRVLDVAVHLGTLLSALLYFRNDILSIGKKAIHPKSSDNSLLINIVIASLPIIVAGFILQYLKFDFLCSIKIMAWMTLIFGIILYIADRFKLDKTLDQMNKKDSLLIGLSQALALIPGVSRSGVTMTTARFLGFSRIESARFSLLLSIIAISGATVLTSVDIATESLMNIGFEIIVAIVLSFLSGYIAISLMMKWLSHASFTPFVIYRVILGIALLTLIYGGFLTV
ncbi:MAG: undecaprenyl-diphosphate phosphatase [Pseudomonadota bacterium]